MSSVQVKICGVTNVGDARACVELGAHLIGLNFYPQSPRYVEPEGARKIVEAVSANIHSVGVFVDATADEVCSVAHLAGIRCVQLHGNSSPEMVRELAREFRVIRAFSTHAWFRPESTSSFVNCDVLIDAPHPDLRGGTGLTCDWLAARATLPLARFLILSGGLNAQNVGQAIAAVAPHAVDVCSGVESAPGMKDQRAIMDFIAAVQATERSLNPTPA
jgi:phosphoribosylanthranilate isomerase